MKKIVIDLGFTMNGKIYIQIPAYKEMYNQRLVYLHENPERAGFVKHPIDWKHSSAIDYYTQEGKGLLELVRLD